jgi:hypothetical protein
VRQQDSDEIGPRRYLVDVDSESVVRANVQGVEVSELVRLDGGGILHMLFLVLLRNGVLVAEDEVNL